MCKSNRRAGRVLLALGLLLVSGWLSAAPVHAQYPPDIVYPHPTRDPYRWVGHFTVFSANALLSGVAAGTLRKARGGSFSDGFTQGVLGGGAVYAGKVVAVQTWTGAGFLGREIAAVGASVVRNAGEGRGALEQVVLPVGPVRLHVHPGSSNRVHATLDLHALFWTGYGFVEPALRFDPGASLSAGAPVFRTTGQRLIWKENHTVAGGMALAGTIYLADLPYQSARDRAVLFAHERVHVLQSDHVFHTIGDPLETWLLGQVPGGRAVAKVLDPNILLWAAAYPAGRMLSYPERPWEMEADFLARP